jgi:DNA modification methylase
MLNRIIHGDCLKVMKDIEDNSIDAIITDPPYPKKYLYLYEAIAKEGKRILKRGGSLLAIMPHYAIPQVTKEVGEHLKWRWILSMWQMQGQHPRMAMGIEIVWKPIGWWVKEAYPNGRGFKRDGFENLTIPKKKEHPWEQGRDWAEYCVNFMPKGSTILDPLCGTGIVCKVAKEKNYNFIGIEIDKEFYNIAINNLRK